MNLTKFSDLGLRALMHMVGSGNARTTAREVAEAINAPRTHVSKVISRLTEFGIIDATRGRGGGITLIDGAEDFSVGAIVRFLEGPSPVIDCEHPHPCPFNVNCRLQHELAQAQEAFFASLDAVTIKDITPVRPQAFHQA
ncbi:MULTISPECIES: RrF2 family transcriptional regulator [Corynebacterium]|uniref:RrF2 family transcriptional regulator n=1 Tax=Corynebacterium TaxID=1716 RepID=UPI00195C7C8D|nr:MULTISPECIES: Rrf2 family transcriptional regulator [Corynebacterium]MDN8625322.1 Rrf2 family transcriptional regulator [Corynebacterium kroppenstedtii]QRQ65059.1 Rrf2 family transcriptional regulator [Corynebacterium kroppenstedtii]